MIPSTSSVLDTFLSRQAEAADAKRATEERATADHARKVEVATATYWRLVGTDAAGEAHAQRAPDQLADALATLDRTPEDFAADVAALRDLDVARQRDELLAHADAAFDAAQVEVAKLADEARRLHEAADAADAAHEAARLAARGSHDAEWHRVQSAHDCAAAAVGDLVGRGCTAKVATDFAAELGARAERVAEGEAWCAERNAELAELRAHASRHGGRVVSKAGQHTWTPPSKPFVPGLLVELPPQRRHGDK